MPPETPGPVIMRVRVMRKLLDWLQARQAKRAGFGVHITQLCEATARCIARDAHVQAAKAAHLSPSPRSLQKSCIQTPSRRVCSTCDPSSRLPDAVEASFALQEASWRVYSYSWSPPALTPLPHSTAPHRPSHDRSTIAPGIRWPGAAAKRQSPTRPHSSVV